MITMMEHIQKECDRQTRKIVEAFKRNRDFDRKVQQVQMGLYQRSPSERYDWLPRVVILLSHYNLRKQKFPPKFGKIGWSQFYYNFGRLEKVLCF
jgi:hypothetical protein